MSDNQRPSSYPTMVTSLSTVFSTRRSTPRAAAVVGTPPEGSTQSREEEGPPPRWISRHNKETRYNSEQQKPNTYTRKKKSAEPQLRMVGMFMKTFAPILVCVFLHEHADLLQQRLGGLL